jgi:UDP-N-acetylglucosamine--N-acetylmuramyl-(pentapeptide) pyrophosphoryl-undecaprenol N-acetylglucosamine transferase
MKVLLTGGGTGGHITPLLAVAQKLKDLDPSTEIVYVGERGTKFASMTAGDNAFDAQYKVFAGKFRRYNGESWLKRLLDVKTNLLNIRDGFYLVLGLIESWFLLRKVKPDVILLKGGFVGVPIGLAARKRIPLVTHDSDAVPGLANRLVSRWAVYHATGMPPEFYQYPKDKMKYVGVIISDRYELVTPSLMHEYRKDLGLPTDAQVLMITGGSLGSQEVNKAVVQFAPQLLESMPKLQIIHQVGSRNTNVYGDFVDARLAVHGLLEYNKLHKYSGAADIIITRAGASMIAEFGIQGKACIVVPNPLLAGGHQTKNADFLKARQAAVVVDEKQLANADTLKNAVIDLLQDDAKREELGSHLHDLTVVDAADNLAKILLSVGGRAGE